MVVRIISIIAYLVLAPIIGCILAGLDRKMSARMQRRVGPPILQPYYDVRKLFEKEKQAPTRFQDFYIIAYLIFLIGAGAIFGIPLIPEDFHISLFVLPPGAFLVMAFLTAAMQYYQDPDKGKKAEKYPSLEDVKTVVVKPAPKPAAPKPAAAAAPAANAAAAAAPKAIEEKIPAPAPAAVKEAAKAAETVKKEAE